MIHGLSKEENEFLYLNLIGPLKGLGCRVFLFGSRATKTNKKFSDIDLLYVPQKAKDAELERYIFILMNQMEDSSFPYKIDLVHYLDLAQSFKNKIDAEKIEL